MSMYTANRSLYILVKKFNYMIEINILRNSSQIFAGVLKGELGGFWESKKHPDALLAEIMKATVKAVFITEGRQFAYKIEYKGLLI